jgi:hypothetical protein
MKKNKSQWGRFVLPVFIFCAAMLSCMQAYAAKIGSIDWSSVPINKPRLFYPGQSSYEWLRIEDHKKASNEVKGGEACLKCHKGEQKSLGGILVEENRLEDVPIEGKKAYLRLAVQAAHDETSLFMRFSWKSDSEQAGDRGNFIRYNGSEWEWYGNHRQHEAVIDEEQPAIYPDRLGIMIGDAKVAMYPDQGCWMTCHDSMVGMAEEADADEVGEHPVISQLYKKFGVTNHLVRKYIPESRSTGTEWAAVKSEKELMDLRKNGAFLDLIIWDAALTNPGNFAADFNVLEIKKLDEGTSALLPNGKMLGGPDFMFDKAKSGFSVLTEADLNDLSKQKHLIIGTNTVAAGASFNEGDILPAHIINTGEAKGSAADVYAKGSWNDGKYEVLIQRKLDTGNPLDDKVLKIGSVYGFGFSIHDDAAGKRAHLVSFPVSIAIGGSGKANIVATTLK